MKASPPPSRAALNSLLTIAIQRHSLLCAPIISLAEIGAKALSLHEQQLYSWGGHVDEQYFTAHLGLGDAAYEQREQSAWRPQLAGGLVHRIQSNGVGVGAFKVLL